MQALLVTLNSTAGFTAARPGYKVLILLGSSMSCTEALLIRMSAGRALTEGPSRGRSKGLSSSVLVSSDIEFKRINASGSGSEQRHCDLSKHTVLKIGVSPHCCVDYEAHLVKDRLHIFVDKILTSKISAQRARFSAVPR